MNRYEQGFVKQAMDRGLTRRQSVALLSAHLEKRADLLTALHTLGSGIKRDIRSINIPSFLRRLGGRAAVGAERFGNRYHTMAHEADMAMRALPRTPENLARLTALGERSHAASSFANAGRRTADFIRRNDRNVGLGIAGAGGLGLLGTGYLMSGANDRRF